MERLKKRERQRERKKKTGWTLEVECGGKQRGKEGAQIRMILE